MKYILFICFTFCSFGLSAQELIVNTPEDLVFEEEFCKEMKTAVNLTNQSPSDLEALWYLDRSNVPDTWSFQICDTKLCYLYGTEVCPASKVNTLIAGMEHLYELKAKSTETGTGKVYLVLHNPNDVSDIYKTVEFDLTFTPCLTSVLEDQLLDPQVVVFPNPIEDRFTILSNVDFDRLVILDLNGREVKRFNQGESFSIMELQSGVYLINVISENNTIIQTKRVYKN